jgi:hypothetical protein
MKWATPLAASGLKALADFDLLKLGESLDVFSVRPETR